MAESSISGDKNLLHIVVIGFHHKKGCQVEFSYPPLVPGTDEGSGEVPLEWKHLPTLALPDGAHNYSKDTVYFHLKNKKGKRKATVYGVSCYRQIDAKDIVNKTDDITRGTVQKSVCVLTTLPCFGAIAAKLELVTHAWFEQRDFTNLELLKDAYNSLAASLSSMNVETQALMGLNVHDVVKLYRHRLLVLFKLMMLERKTVFFMTPVCDLCNVILSILSLFPGLMEVGLVESVENTKTPILSPTMTERTFSSDPNSEPFLEINYTRQGSISSQENETNKQTPSESADQSSHNSSIISQEETEPDVSPGENTTQSKLVTDKSKKDENTDNEHVSNMDSSLKTKAEPIATVNTGSGDTADGKLDKGPELLTESQTVDNHVSHARSSSNLSAPADGVPDLASEDSLLQIDMEDQETALWDSKKHSLTLTEDGSIPKAESNIEQNMASRKRLTIDIADVRTYEVVPIVSPTSISIDKAGLPLAIFTKGSVCHPYLSLSYYDILEDVNVRSFVIGASNVLFKQKRHNIDVLVEKNSTKKDDPGGIVILDKELQKQLQLSTEDLRFADNISKRVDDTAAEGAFLEGTEWEGGDEWIRAQFKDYLMSLMATVLAEDDHLLEAFNPAFVRAWKTTHNYRVWRNTVQQLEDVIPGHPCQGGVTLNDVKLQLARSERGRKINAVVDQAGKAMTDTTKAVGGAIHNARSMVSSWWSNVGTGSSNQSDNNG